MLGDGDIVAGNHDRRQVDLAEGLESKNLGIENVVHDDVTGLLLAVGTVCAVGISRLGMGSHALSLMAAMLFDHCGMSGCVGMPISRLRGRHGTQACRRSGASSAITLRKPLA